RNDRKGAYTWYDNDSTVYEGSYGKLYNYYAVQTGKLCPKGWRVPDAGDWDRLISYLDSISVNGGCKGFNPLAGGYRGGVGAWLGRGRTGFWWGSTGTRARVVWDPDTKPLYRINDRALSLSRGFCIRCIKD